MQLDIVPHLNWPRVPRISSWMPSLPEDEDWPFFQESSSGLAMSEDNKNVYVEAALPGINPNDIEVTFNKGVLWIRGQAKEEEGDKQRKYYKKSARSFSYRTVVPESVDEGIEPEVVGKNGMLRVTFAKAAPAEPKKLKVKS